MIWNTYKPITFMSHGIVSLCISYKTLMDLSRRWQKQKECWRKYYSVYCEEFCLDVTSLCYCIRFNACTN